jgi:hypothetical protein
LGALENKGKFLWDHTKPNSVERIAICPIDTGVFGKSTASIVEGEVMDAEGTAPITAAGKSEALD